MVEERRLQEDHCGENREHPEKTVDVEKVNGANETPWNKSFGRIIFKVLRIIITYVSVHNSNGNQ